MFRTPAENRRRVVFAGLAGAALVTGTVAGVLLPLPARGGPADLYSGPAIGECLAMLPAMPQECGKN